MSTNRYKYSNNKRARYDKKTNSYQMLVQSSVPYRENWVQMPDQNKNSIKDNLKLLESIASLRDEGKAKRYNNKQQETTFDTSME